MKIRLLHILIIMLIYNCLNAQELDSLIYVNDKLGISFKYSKWDDSLYDYEENEPKLNLSSWKTYYSKKYGISFKYPPSLTVQEGILNYDLSLEKRWLIKVGFFNTIDKESFYTYINITIENQNFEEIASNYDFIFSQKKDSFFMEGLGFKMEATKFKGTNLTGLRVGVGTMKYSDEYHRSIPSNENISLLVFDKKKKDKSKIVMFYSDNISYTIDEEGLSQIELSEHEFYLIASTLKIQ